MLNRLQTRELVLHGDADLSKYGSLEERTNAVRRSGGLYSIYGVGVSVVAAPLYAVAARTGISHETLEALSSIPFVAGAVLAFYLLCLRLFDRSTAVAGTVLFGFGTTLWPVAATAFWQHAPVALFQVLGLRAFFDERTHAPFWAGLALGAATFVRPTLAILTGLVGVFYLATGPRRALRFAAGAAIPFAAIAVQNRWIWGSFLEGGYSHAGIGFRHPIVRGLRGELFGWWRGLFVYSPVLLLGILAWPLTFRRGGQMERRLLLLGVASIAYLLFYARWTTWWGGFNFFGYRYLLDAVPMLVLLTIWGARRVRRIAPLAISAGVLSVATMAFGAEPQRFGWDFHLFPTGFNESPIGQAWIVGIDRPLGAALRLAGVAAVGLVLWLFASHVRVAPDTETPA